MSYPEFSRLLRLASTIVLCLIAAALALPANAAERTGCTKYAVAYWAHQTVGGEFDGATVLSSVNGEFAVPSVADGIGYGLAVGGRTRWVGLEFGFRWSEHTVSWQGHSSNGTHRLLSAEGRFFPTAFRWIRPFVSGGAFMEWLTANNAYCSTMTGGNCTERFNGFGLSIGGGALVPLQGRLFAVGQVQYRHSQYDSIKSLEISDGTLSYTLDGGGWSVRTGLGLEF